MFIYDTSSYVARQRAPYDSNCHLLRLEEMPLKMPILDMEIDDNGKVNSLHKITYKWSIE